jgi:hypothetical protein
MINKTIMNNNYKEQKPTTLSSLAMVPKYSVISTSAHVGIASFKIELSIP